MAFKMKGYSAFTKDTKFKGSKHDVGQGASVNTGPSNKEINALKNIFKQLKKLGAENEIVKPKFYLVYFFAPIPHVHAFYK